MAGNNKARQGESQAVLEIVTLGDFRVKFEDRDLTKDANRSYRLWELFKLLLTNRERGVLPEVLVDTLWPDQEYSEPKSAVRTMVYRLRQLLAAGPGEEGVNLISFDQGCYRWNNQGSYWFDAQEFENLVQKAQALVRKNPDEAIYLFQRALPLYKGEYLPETAFSEWVLPQRHYYRRLYLEGVVTLAELLKGAGRYDEMISLCEDAIRIEPFEEELHIPFLEALLEKGKKKQALTHYEYITAALYQELGVKPSEPMRHLYRLIQVEGGSIYQDLTLVQERLRGSAEGEGAFLCDPDVFRFLYKLEHRRAERKEQEVALALVTLAGFGQMSPRVLREAMDHLQAVLLACLRKGDVITRWNEAQFLVMLADISIHQAKKVLRRVEASFWGTWGREEDRLVLQSKLQALLPA